MADNDAPNNYDQQNDKPKAELITVQVKSGGDGVEVYFKIKKTTHFRKVRSIMHEKPHLLPSQVLT
jgi:hypothetical protein